MTSNQPPKLATWMLKHFGSGPDNNALLGDLTERYVQKGSRMWYRRQAMKAIPISFFKEIRGHKRIAARALVTGWVMWILCGLSIPPLVSPFFFGAWGVWRISLLGGGLLAHPVNKSAEFPHIYPFVFAVAMPLMVGVLCGWLVARFHRNQQTAVILLFAGSILLMDLLLFGLFILFVRPITGHVFGGPLGANAAASVLGILLGGGLFRDHSRAASN
jgi:hypothetical protein